ADDISIQVEETLSMITNVLSYHMNVGQKIEIETSAIVILIQKVKLNALINMTISYSNGVQINLPKLDFCGQNCTQDTPVTLN
ncbi:unnamed protein product, partial [Didymodactylos carnosus]